jgi:hypothetical protein
MLSFPLTKTYRIIIATVIKQEIHIDGWKKEEERKMEN